MIKENPSNHPYGNEFVEKMPGAAFVCRAGKKRELLYVNQRLVDLFECEDREDFMQHVGGCFDGMVTEAQLRSIQKEIELQVGEKGQKNGRLFYHVMTKKGSLYLAEEHWSLEEDPVEGPLYYCVLISREHEAGGSDYDPITGLYGKSRFQSYAMELNRELSHKDADKYAIAYLNLVNFKLLNVNKGIDEGDACLRAIADCLGYVFEDAFLARLSDDHFAILDKRRGLEQRMDESRAYFRKKHGDRFGVIGKWGFYSFIPSEEFDAEKALSYAKIACDHIKYVSNVAHVEYTEQLALRQNKAEHLARSFDEALDKGWIKVYYQPVIRSITEELCGMESLVRWVDPQFGFITPNDFIGVLEDSRQIHKLDSYVVEQVCRTLRDRVETGKPIVPVSVNFSRLDFVMCDMLDVVETAIEKYDIPRDYLHVEITESMIASDEALMRGVIDGFRTAGYEIWMDDFGSGYSSLTLLKDYQFDMLKLDMNFLSNFTDKSRDIMRSAVIMAKDLGIKTLAEGVETKEQLEYLKDVGCEQIQGYYYGRPEPIEDVFRHLEEKAIAIELRKWRHFYEIASFYVKATDLPLEVIEDDGHSFRTLFMNEAYREQIGLQGMDLKEIDRRIYHTASPLLTKYREFAEQMKNSGKPEVFYYTKGQGYLCLRGQAVAQNEGRAIIKASIINVAADRNLIMTEQMDSKLRALNLLFKVILHADVKNQTLTPLLGTSPNMKTQNMEQGSVRENNALFADVNIHPTERSRYREFMDFSTARERIERSRFGYVSEIFRIKQPDGNYRMAEVTLMIIPGTDGQEFLYCVKPYLPLNVGMPEGVGGLLKSERPSENVKNDDETSRLLWDNMLWNSSVKFFWKDADRKFMGASQAFLDFFGIKSVEELVGKTDEDMHWHVNDGPYREREISILQRGIRIMDEPGQCIAKGVIHNIVSSKMPLYKDGLIIGIAGYFLDIDKDMSVVQEGLRKVRKDPVTGLLDLHTFLDAMIDYAIQHHDGGRDYAVILARNLKHERIVKTYGEEMAGAALKEMGSCILDVMGQNCVVARVKEAIFGVLTYVENEQEAREKADQIARKLGGINAVKGNAITTRIRVVAKVRSQEGITDENIYEQALKEVMKVTIE